MSRWGRTAWAASATVLAAVLVGSGLWVSGGTSWQAVERLGWLAGVGAFVFPVTGVWVWALRSAGEPESAPRPDRGGWWSAPVREVDALRAGAHRSQEGLPPYVARDRDAELADRVGEAVEHGGMVLVVGPSTTGKTRAAWNAVANHLGDRHVFVPAPGCDPWALLGAVAEHARRGGRAVVWLDDLDRHLRYGTDIDQAVVQRLHEAHAVIVATMRQGPYDDLTSSAAGERGSAERNRQLVRTAVVRMDRTWSEQELERAAASGSRPLADAARRQRADRGHGVGEYLASAPQLLELWHATRDLARGEGGHPRGHRVVAAAVDLARIGVARADTALLEAAHHAYPLPPVLRPESFAEALAWATREHENTCGLLLPAGDGDPDLWRPFDYLVDETDTPVPPQLWDIVLDRLDDPDAQVAFGWAAYDTDRFAVAEAVWRKAAEVRSPRALNGLGCLCLRRGDAGEAESWFRQAVDAGHTGAMCNLGMALSDQPGKEGEAETWYRRAITAGSVAAMTNLGVLLSARGDKGEAESWYRRAWEKGSAKAAANLGHLLADRGDHDEAVVFLRSAAEAGGTRSVGRLGRLLYQRGRPEEAEAWLLRAAGSGETDAMMYLFRLYTERGEPEQALSWLRRAADGGSALAMYGMGAHLTADDPAEAEAWFRRGAEAGLPAAEYALGVRLKARGESAEAEAWIRKAADTGEPSAMFALGKDAYQRDDRVEARRWFHRAAEDGHSPSTLYLGLLCEEEDDPAGAETWYRRGADAGDVDAMTNLGYLLQRRRGPHEAEAWYRKAAEGGRLRAMTHLADILVGRDEHDEAGAWYRKAAAAGYPRRRRSSDSSSSGVSWWGASARGAPSEGVSVSSASSWSANAGAHRAAWSRASMTEWK
ncbi:tetratricopeptide repeat protein [Streptomonospora halotolerans]|nr:tetratricopeptide repeat protein [Streptomonospora nanhaiensis]